MVGTAQPLCLFASETEGRRYDNDDESAEKENSQNLAPLLGLDGKTISPLPPVVGEVFFLTSPFIESGYGKSEVLVPKLPVSR